MYRILNYSVRLKLRSAGDLKYSRLTAELLLPLIEAASWLAAYTC